MATPSLKPAVFFDRDGTLIEDRGYLRSASEVVFFEDAFSALKRLMGHCLLFIVTNQQGIGLGLVSTEEVERVNQAVVNALADRGVIISAVYVCPHTRDQGCECRKPKPFFLRKAAQEFHLDLSRSFVFGDHPSDVQLAESVGARGIYLLTGHGRNHLEEVKELPGVSLVKNLTEGISLIQGEILSVEEHGLVRRAAAIIQQGGLVVFPTETVYGLGADVFSPLAVARIFEVKRRPYFDPLIVHIAQRGDLSLLATEVPSPVERLIERFWPGPLTVVLPKKEDVPDLVTAGLPTVAIRMPDHPIALSLIEASGRPIAAPSANPFGCLSPTTADHVREQLGDQVDLILDGGACQVGVESTVVSFVEGQPRLLRPGGVTLEEIEAMIGPVELNSTEDVSPSSPGMLTRHYAPQTPLVIRTNQEEDDFPRGRRRGLLVFQEPKSSHRFEHVEVLSPAGDLRTAAANLFAAIRRLDALNLDLIVADPIPEVGLGRAIMDRLRRASSGAPEVKRQGFFP